MARRRDSAVPCFHWLSASLKALAGSPACAASWGSLTGESRPSPRVLGLALPSSDFARVTVHFSGPPADEAAQAPGSSQHNRAAIASLVPIFRVALSNL